MGTPPPFTDEEIFGGATRRLLSGVDFRFLTASCREDNSMTGWRKRWRPMVKRLERLVKTATSAHDKMVLEENSHLVARLPAAGYGTTEFEMNDDRRNALVEGGARGYGELS